MSSRIDRVVLLRTLGCAAVAAGLAAACSSSETSVDPGTSADGGVVEADGSAPPPLPATCTDKSKSGDESDVDCGGACAKCDVAKGCNVAGDCASGVCIDKGDGKKCQAPSATDATKNGAETDVDCGGTGNPKCADGKGCIKRDDCTSDVCTAGTCAAPTTADGAKNGTETDVDCGGPTAPRCNDLLGCAADADCKSDVCKDVAGKKSCQAPTSTDGKKNGTETDVDCGGAGNPGCAVGLACAANTDCASLGCNYDKKCASARSCTRHYGGDTCGLEAAPNEDCCATAPVTTTIAGVPTTVQMDRFQTTGGRMRAFLEAVGYDVRTFVKTARAAGKIPVIPGNAAGKTVLEADWDMYLPTSFAGNTNADEIADGDQGNPTTPQAGIYTSVRRHLGGLIFRNNSQSSTGCFVGSPGTHIFRFPDGQQDGPAPSYDETVYDTKSMQCIDYLVGQAFCVWDGGRLETLAEWQAANGPDNLPWGASAAGALIPEAQNSSTFFGCRYPTITDALLQGANPNGCAAQYIPDAAHTVEYAAYAYSYESPNLMGLDYVSFISAPGRTRGRGPGGHADLYANNFELTSTVTYNADPFAARHRWSGNGSWEGHGYSKSGGGNTMLLNKYGKLGLRCVKL